MAFRREVFKVVRFDENLPGYGQLEDADISQQVLKAGYKIYYEAAALLEHKVSSHDRLNDSRLAEMTVLNYVYLFRKHFPQSLPRKLAHYWTLLGLFILYIPGSTGWQGVIRGVRRILDDQRLGYKDRLC
jgi:GT2 family glycosyltransferase